MRNLSFFLILLVFGSCQSQENTEQQSSNNSSNNSNQEEVDSIQSDSNNESDEITYTASAIFDDNLGWGYQILNNGKPYINQPHIPAIEGMKGFNNEADALTTAEFVITKLNNNIVPPSVSIAELDSLGISY